MTSEQTQRLIERLMNVFPSFGAWVEKHSSQLREVWRSVLAHANFDDASLVVEKLVCGEIEMPANYEYDRMAILIRKEAGRMTAARNERKTQFEKYLSHGAMEFVKRDKTGSIAVMIGQMVREKRISKEDNDLMMLELIAWDKGGEFPKWMNDLFGIKQERSVA